MCPPTGECTTCKQKLDHTPPDPPSHLEACLPGQEAGHGQAGAIGANVCTAWLESLLRSCESWELCAREGVM